MIEFDAGTSSVNKGETLYDTILTMSALGVDICVVRHSEVDYYKQLIDSRTIQTSIVNGGDGSGQHPSQCLLDLMTIYEEFGTFEILRFVLQVILRIRVSLSQICRFSSVWELSFILLVLQSGTRMSLMFMVSMWPLTTSLRTWMFSCCFVFSTSVMGMTKDFQKKTTHALYGLTEERYAKLADQAIIMHPAPVNRDVEIADSLVEAPKARIVAQMQNGVFVRMAIIEAILNGKA